MSEAKYYWLKLNKDFFSSKRIKKLRKLAGGDTFTIIYLKMQLKSLTGNGVLVYTGLENSFEEELALDIDEDLENVKITVAYLLKCGLLIEENEESFSLPFVQNSIIAETSSAIRGKAYRERQKALRTNKNERKPNVEIDIEKDIDIDIDKEIDKESKKKKPSTPKEIYGEFKNIKLTLEEFDKLCDLKGHEEAVDAIELLSSYKQEKPSYKTHSDYLTIRRWVFDAVEEKKRRKGQSYIERIDNRMNVVDEWLKEEK